MASAIQGSTMGDNVWFSALNVVIHAHNCQVHHGRMVTAHEELTGEPPNMDNIFKFRIGQLVTVTNVTDKRSKTEHELRGATGYCLHSHHISRGISTWVWIPSLHKALLRGEKDLQVITMPVPNQSILVHQGALVQGNNTYPDPSIIKLIDAQVDMEGDLTTVTGTKEDNLASSKETPMDTDARRSTSQVTATNCNTPMTAPSEMENPTETTTYGEPCDELIGRRIGKNFKGKGFFTGTIVSFNKPYYKVEYDDGDDEEFYRTHVTKLLLSDKHASEANSMHMDKMATSNSSVKPKKSVTFQTTAHQPSTYPIKEFTIQQAYKEDKTGWKPVVDTLLDDCMNNVKSFRLVNASDVPREAIILPSSVMCKYKVDTKHAGQDLVRYARFFIQDAKSRRQVNRNDVWATVARAKTIRKLLCTAAWFGLNYCMKDIRRAFPKTQLTSEYKGQVFLMFPPVLGFGDGVMGEMLTFIEGFQPSNHAFDVNVRKALERHGFKLCPSDDQLITKEESNGHFLTAVKVVDNFLIVSTSEHLTLQLEEAITSAGYEITAEADDKFIGIQLQRMSNGEIHAHQGRHAKELIRKYGITSTALTPLSSSFSGEDYIASGLSTAKNLAEYQQLVGDVTWLTMTRYDVVYPASAVAQKTGYCSDKDYAEALRILEYINLYPDQPIIFHAAPRHKQVPTRHILRSPVTIYINADASHRQAGRPEEARDQIGYFVRLFTVDNAAVQVVSKVKDTTLSSAEAEVSCAVPAVCDGLDSYFVLNHIGFSNIGQLLLEGDNNSAEALETTPACAARKRSRHFIGSAAFIRQFYDRFLLWIVHTPSTNLSSNALTKRVTEEEQVWATNDMRGFRNRPTDVAKLQHVPIMRADHLDMWPVIPCAAEHDYHNKK